MKLKVCLVSSMISKLRMACISDVHLGHHRTKTSFIVKNLRKAFFDTDVLANLDIFLIAGDFFDRLLSLPLEEVHEINDWIVGFLARCAKHNVMLRVLEGTPSHDWRQSRLFDELNRHLGTPVDLKYVDTLSIEYIEKLDATILYVPDEWSEEADNTWVQVTNLMRGMGLNQVDFACMHGVFQHQLPITSPVCHNEQRYLEIVREVIWIGHHHNHTRYEHIFAQGSFDRLCHGDESRKGYGLYTYDNGVRTLEFIENPGAKIYQTLNYVGLDIETVVKRLQAVENYPDDSHFRIVTSRADGVASAIGQIKDRYPQFNWTTQLEELTTSETTLQNDTKDDVPKPISINRENIERLVREKLITVAPDTSPEVERALFEILERVA